MPSGKPKYQEAENRLPVDLRPIFKQFVEEYEYLTSIHYGKGYIAYKVLAEMVLAGWRPSGDRHKDSQL